MICILTTSGKHPVFSFLNYSGQTILREGELQSIMAFWLQHPLFTKMASDILVPKEKLKRRLEVELELLFSQSVVTDSL